jgi:hypothetical protein
MNEDTSTVFSCGASQSSPAQTESRVRTTEIVGLSFKIWNSVFMGALAEQLCSLAAAGCNFYCN